MRKVFFITLCISLVVMAAAGRAYADLKTLIKLGQQQAQMAKVSKEETKSYNKVRDAIDSGKLEEGMEAGKIRKKYGEPIFDNIFDEKRNAYKWLYMPATSTHFEGEKLYLFVNEDGMLVGWKLIEPAAEEAEEN